MDNNYHKSLLLTSLQNMLKSIDSLHIHPKNKLLRYDRYVLSKLSWHFTVADISKTWICEHLDNIVTKCVRQWLDLTISATISSLILSHKKLWTGSSTFLLQIPAMSYCSTLLIETVARQSLIIDYGRAPIVEPIFS